MKNDLVHRSLSFAARAPAAMAFLVMLGGNGMGAAIIPPVQPSQKVPRDWRREIAPSDWKLIKEAKTASECLALADKEIRLGYWRLHHLSVVYRLSGGKVSTMSPPAAENWGTAIEAFRRGLMVVRLSARRNTRVPPLIEAKLISRRAMFLFQHSSKTEDDARKALPALVRASRLASVTPEILCDLARLYSDTVQTFRPGPPTAKQRVALKTALRYANEAIAADPKCALGYMFRAGAIIGLAGTAGIKPELEANVKALELSRFIYPAVYTWDYHYINWGIGFITVGVKTMSPAAYRRVYSNIVHFSGEGKVLSGKPK